MAKRNSINNATQDLTIDPGASGDSFVQFDINTSGKFRIGIDDDAGDAFKISQGSALGTNDTFVMTSAGERTMPLQPAFLAYLGATDSNVTGDSTIFYLGTGTALTKLYDQNSDLNTNGTFTAPITGKYLFSSSVTVDNITAGMVSGILNLETTARFFQGNHENVYALQSSGNATIKLSMIADMTIGDTAKIRVVVGTSTKTAGVLGGIGTTIYSSFSGSLVC